MVLRYISERPQLRGCAVRLPYEQEMWMIANPAIADHRDKTPDGQNLYLFKFPPDCLSEIVFGIRTHDDLKRHLTRVIKEHYPHVKILQASLNQEKFDLDITPVF